MPYATKLHRFAVPLVLESGDSTYGGPQKKTAARAMKYPSVAPTNNFDELGARD
jgi:hypothetical protein